MPIVTAGDGHGAGTAYAERPGLGQVERHAGGKGHSVSRSRAEPHYVDGQTLAAADPGHDRGAPQGNGQAGIESYAEKAKIAARNVRRDGMEALKAAEKKGKISQDEQKTVRNRCCRRSPTSRSLDIDAADQPRRKRKSSASDAGDCSLGSADGGFAGCAIWRSSWMATAGGPKRAACRAIAGHRAGVEAVRRVVEAAPDLGIEVLTLYAFSSSENWKRPADEVADLMGLLRHYIQV